MKHLKYLPTRRKFFRPKLKQKGVRFEYWMDEKFTRISFFDVLNLFKIRQWPKNHCFVFACLTCTISMFSISRFAILSIDYGGKNPAKEGFEDNAFG